MEKIKLIECRKAKGLSQKIVAETLCMDVSNYNRRERGTVKITMREWEKLADILHISIEDIYESNENQSFIYRNGSTVHHYQGTNNIDSMPEYLLETQRKYIEKLEKEILVLQNNL
jgi:transcriptional regulator with XRE-family HTH domain